MIELDQLELEELHDLEALPIPVRLRRVEHGQATIRREVGELKKSFAVLMGQVKLAAAFGAVVGAAIATAIVDLLLKHYG